MKIKLITIFFLLTVSLAAQDKLGTAFHTCGEYDTLWTETPISWYDSPDTTEPKVDYKYILIYRYPSYGRWKNKIEGFKTWTKLLERLNTGDIVWFGQPKEKKDVSLNEINLIAVYDLSRCNKVPMKLNRENRVQEKEIIVERQEWTDLYWSEDK